MCHPESPPLAKPWVIFLLDERGGLGAAIKAVARRGLQTTFRTDRARRFKSKADAKAWLRKVPKEHRIRARFRPLIERI